MLGMQAVGASIVIAGPTAIGKTGTAVELARARPERFEIISADSIQAYRRFDIGSAKPTPEERNVVPFHLVDVVNPDDDFSLVDYQLLAYAAIQDIISRGKTPLIVGGTGLYIRSIISGLGVPLAGPDEELRGQLTERANSEGSSVLHNELKAVDEESAARIHQNDLKRIIRALEVFILTGRSLSSWHHDDAKRERGVPLAYFCLNRVRETLYHQIDLRTEAMFENGIVDEVAALRAEGYSATLKPMSALAYAQSNHVVDGTLTTTEAVTLTKNATHQYARRQLIWFRGEEGVTWIDIEGETPATTADKILARLKL